MEIHGKKVMVWGAAGMVGQAIVRSLVREKPKTLFLVSLYEHEVEALKEALMKEFGSELPEIETAWGNLLVRHIWKDMQKMELLSDAKIRQQMVLDIIEPLTRESLTASAIFQLCQQHKPDILIDTLNFATALVSHDCWGASREAMQMAQRQEGDTGVNADQIMQGIEKMVLSQYTPQITKHVQILYQTLLETKTLLYLKIGTLGHLGMELKIPYTHSLDNPPQDLLAKSALAGAHSLLLLMMSKTPGGPIIKEIKPSTAVAWKQIGFGPVLHRGRAIPMEDVSLADAVSLAGKLLKTLSKKPKHLKYDGEPMALTAPFIDLGENSLFAMGEFEFLTEANQLGFVSPDEVAQAALDEIRGTRGGSDIIAAMDSATLKPSYRAALSREKALTKLREICEKKKSDSVAFELLGPPRLSKILYEAHLLKMVYGTGEVVLNTEPEEMSRAIEKFILEKEQLRSQIISIGMPILLSKGDRLLRGSKMAIPADMPGKPDATFDITEGNIDRWTHDGWIDLRPKNMTLWQQYVEKWPGGNGPIHTAKIASWVLGGK